MDQFSIITYRETVNNLQRDCKQRPRGHEDHFLYFIKTRSSFHTHKIQSSVLVSCHSRLGSRQHLQSQRLMCFRRVKTCSPCEAIRVLQILKYKSYSEFGIYHMIAASQADLRAYFNLSHIILVLEFFASSS